MPLWLLLLVLALAVYRVTRFWVKDSLLDEIRPWVKAVTLGSKGRAWRFKLNELLECPYCISGHLSWIAVVVAMQWQSIPLPGITWLAIWGLHPVLWRLAELPVEVHAGFTNTLKHRETKFDQ